MARSKAEIEVKKKKERLRELQRGPDLEQYLEGRKRRFTTYVYGARIMAIKKKYSCRCLVGRFFCWYADF